MSPGLSELPVAVLSMEQLVIHIPGRRAGMELECRIEAGQCWGILGPNGTGKTTLLHTLAGLRPPRSGRIWIEDRLLTQLSRRQIARKLGLLFQQQQDEFPATVLETALIGRHPYLRVWELESETDHRSAWHALERLDLTSLAQRSVQTLSGGERQRLALSTLLAQDPALWLLDEPTNHLDLHHQIAVLALIQQEVEQGRAAVMALHDINLAARFCTHVLLLFADGSACWGPVDTMLVTAALERLYQQPLATAVIDGWRVFIPKS